MTESIPPGKDGNIPRGLFIPLFLSSQKHRGHSRKRFSDDGDNLISLFSGVLVSGARSFMRAHRVICSPLIISVVIYSIMANIF
jgi:hypothetical protein